MSPNKIHCWVRAAVALSLSNLCYLLVWDALFHDPFRDYLSVTPYGRSDFIAAILGVGLGAAVLYFIIGGLCLNRLWGVRCLAMLTIALVVCIPLNFVRRVTGLSYEFYSNLPIIVAAILLIGMILIFRVWFVAATFWLLAILSPYACITLFSAAYHASFPSKEEPRRKIDLAGGAQRQGPLHRVVWIVFDEWDQTATFDNRPKGLKLPNIDAFMSRSVVAIHALPPSGSTMLSMPAMLTGHLVSAARTPSDSTLLLKYFGEDKWRDFRSCDNVISDLLKADYTVEVLGWHHPYQRILPTSPNLEAHSWGQPISQGFRRKSIMEGMLAQLEFIVYPQYGRIVSRDMYQELHARALNAVGNPHTNLTFLHYGIPHLPGIYDPAERQLSPSLTTTNVGYCNNLSLVDRTLGELVRSVEAAGLSESTSFVITSDHWWRTSPWEKGEASWRIPLLIQLPGSAGTEVVDTRICTVSISRIVSRLVRGELQTATAVAALLKEGEFAASIQYVDGAPEIGAR